MQSPKKTSHKDRQGRKERQEEFYLRPLLLGDLGVRLLLTLQSL